MLQKVFGPPLASASRRRNSGMHLEHPGNSQNPQPLQTASAGASTALPVIGGAANSPPGPKSTVRRLSRARRVGETADSYSGVVVILNNNWRVIADESSTQWILQRRSGDEWRGYWFCRTSEALVRGARQHAGKIHGDALAVLWVLPPQIGGAP